MSSSLIFDGKKFISAKEAGKLTGYAPDYVGQLSRGKKIEARLVGRTWYVSEESILSHKGISSPKPVIPQEEIISKSSPEIISKIVPSSSVPEPRFYQTIPSTRTAEPTIPLFNYSYYKIG